MNGGTLNRILISLAMMLAGGAVSGGAVSMFPQTMPAQPAAAQEAPAEPELPQESIPETVPETIAPPETEDPGMPGPGAEPVSEIPEPGPSVYNFRYLFPDGADPEDPLQSYGGKAFCDLYAKDTDWQTSVFRYSTQRPEKAAAALGIDRSRIMGKYNITDSTHDIDDPSTWDIGKWKNINVSITDGNGSAKPVSSNVKEILAMASVYCWYNRIEDYDTFYSYARKLWNASHSSSASIGEVYYDSEPCLTQEQIMKAIGKGNGVSKPEKTSSASAGTAGASHTQAAGSVYPEASPGDASLPDAAGAEGRTPGYLPADASPDQIYEYVYGSDSAGQSSETASGDASAGALPEYISGNPDAEQLPEYISGDASSGQLPEYIPGDDASGRIPEYVSGDDAAGELPEYIPGDEASGRIPEYNTGDLSAEETQAAVDPKIRKYMTCPGHVDLSVRAVIYGLDGNKNLFTLDPVGGSKKNFNENWQGWTETAMAEAKALAAADWYESYGLSVSLFSKTSPLSASEIEAYLELLPKDLSEPRRKLAETALGSIGRIPYYFGGKASSPEFDKNHFGTLVAPDYKGRVFRGLDCSGWLAWTWWNTFGTPLGESSTAGMIHLGHEIRRKDLQTGDIIIRAGGEETIGHVLMFFRWDENGNAVCIHETGGVTNNVVMANQTDTGMSCRNIID